MRNVSQAFLDSIPGAHGFAARCRLVPFGQTGVTPKGVFLPWQDDPYADPTTWGQLPILDGEVTTDMTADIQSVLALTTEYPFPVDSSAPGTPYGSEIYAERGVIYGNGITELVGLGYFGLQSVEKRGILSGAQIAASDRMKRIQDYRPIAPVTFPGSMMIGDVLDQAVQEACPGVPTDYGDLGAYVTPLGSDHVMDDDRLGFIQDLVASYGCYAFFDYRGYFCVRLIPTDRQEPVWTISSGRDGTLVDLSRTLSRDGVYNVAVATGDTVGDSPPVRGAAYDDNPQSPTYVGGDFGIVPVFMSSSFITNAAQANAAALGLLQRQAGLPYQIELDAAVNPALEGWDVVSVEVSQAGVTAVADRHVLDRITYPLTADRVQSISSRKQFR